MLAIAFRAKIEWFKVVSEVYLRTVGTCQSVNGFELQRFELVDRAVYVELQHLASNQNRQIGFYVAVIAVEVRLAVDTGPFIHRADHPQRHGKPDESFEIT